MTVLHDPDVESRATALDENPYAGANPLDRRDNIYGRGAELAELTSLLLAHRVVVLYSVSGLGKTSLLKAGLLRRVDERFDITYVDGFPLPARQTGPDGQVPDQDVAPAPTTNPYIARVSDRLARPDPEIDQADGSTGDRLLILDQFEELFTLRVVDWPDKREFLDWLANFLREPNVWAIVSLREEYVGALKPYRAQFSGHLSTELRLEPLGRKAATEAMIGPAAERGAIFDPNLAAGLADVLSDTVVKDLEGNTQIMRGESVEPMHLQLTCHKLWKGWWSERENNRLTVSAVDQLGLLRKVEDVSQTLAEHYDETVAAVTEHHPTRERDLRDWFQKNLLTTSGHRRPAEWLTDDDEGRRVIGLLEKACLVRRPPAARDTSLVELSHDLLVDAVRDANGRAFEKVEPLHTDAEHWNRREQNLADRTDLLREIVDAHPDLVSAEEINFVEESERRVARLAEERRREQEAARRAQEAEELQRQQEAKSAERSRKRHQRYAIVAAVLLLIGGIALVVYLNQRSELGESQKDNLAMERLNGAVRDADDDLEESLSRTIAAADVYVERGLGEDSLPVEFRETLYELLARSPTRGVLTAEDGAPEIADAVTTSHEAGLVITADTGTKAVVRWRVGANSFDEAGELGRADGVVQLVSTPDASRVIAVTDDGGTVDWAWRGDRYITSSGPAGVTSVALRSDGGLVWVDGAAAVRAEHREGPIGPTGMASVAATNEYIAMVPRQTEDTSGVLLFSESDDLIIGVDLGGPAAVAAFSPDGGHLVIGTQFGTIGLVDPGAAAEFDAASMVSAHASPIRQISFLGGTSEWLVSVADDGEVAVWQIEDGALTLRRTVAHPAKTARSVAPLAWRSQLVVLTGLGTVERWDVSVGHDLPISAMATYNGADGPVLLTGDQRGEILEWELPILRTTPLSEIHRPDPPAPVVDLTRSSDGSHVVVAWGDNHLDRFPCANDSCSTQIDSESVIVEMAIRNNGEVVVLTAGGEIWTWRLGQLPKMVRTLARESTHLAIVTGEGGFESIVVVADAAFVQLDPGNWAVVAEQQFTGAATSLQAAGGSVVLGVEGGSLQRFDVSAESSAVVGEPSVVAPALSVVDASESRQYRATVDGAGSVQIWQTLPDQPVASSRWQHRADLELAAPAMVTSFVRARDGEPLLVVGGLDGRIEVFLLSDKDHLDHATSIAVWSPGRVDCDRSEIGWMPACQQTGESTEGPVTSTAELAFAVLTEYTEAISVGDWVEARRLRPALGGLDDAALDERFGDIEAKAEFVSGKESGDVVEIRALLIFGYPDGFRDVTCGLWIIDKSDAGLTTPDPTATRITVLSPDTTLDIDSFKADCAEIDLTTTDS